MNFLDNKKRQEELDESQSCRELQGFMYLVHLQATPLTSLTVTRSMFSMENIDPGSIKVKQTPLSWPPEAVGVTVTVQTNEGETDGFLPVCKAAGSSVLVYTANTVRLYTTSTFLLQLFVRLLAFMSLISN